MSNFGKSNKAQTTLRKGTSQFSLTNGKSIQWKKGFFLLSEVFLKLREHIIQITSESLGGCSVALCIDFHLMHLFKPAATIPFVCR